MTEIIKFCPLCGDDYIVIKHQETHPFGARLIAFYVNCHACESRFQILTSGAKINDHRPK